MKRMMLAPPPANATSQVTVLTPPEINAIPWRPVPLCPGVWAKQLCDIGGVVHAMIALSRGTSIPGHPHPAAHQHIWVLAGRAVVAGHWVSEGAYVHVPPGVEHAVTDVGVAGCTLLQVHIPT